MKTYKDRKDQYMAIHKLWPDEIAGSTDLDCEMDLRGIGRNDYAIKDYCTQLTVDRCANCSLCNYGRDCHNNPVARDEESE